MAQQERALTVPSLAAWDPHGGKERTDSWQLLSNLYTCAITRVCVCTCMFMWSHAFYVRIREHPSEVHFQASNSGGQDW